MLSAVFGIALAACGFPLPADLPVGSDGGVDGGATDGGGDDIGGNGCSTARPCLTFEPSNGLGVAFPTAKDEADVILPRGVRIDTDLGLVQAASGEMIPVRSMTIPQSGTRPIRVLIAGSFVIDDASVTGATPLALAAAGRLVIRGHVDASAVGIVAGPGAQEPPSPCAGTDSRYQQLGVTQAAAGAGGGGNGTAGGDGGGLRGGSVGRRGGAIIPTFEPLVGGCRGGSMSDTMNQLIARGGGGGGAIQLVSASEVAFTTTGFIDVGGGGGVGTGAGLGGSGAGGSGGTVIIEAPKVTFEGGATGIAANGGAGGACRTAGQDGLASDQVSVAPVCSNATGGNGGTGTTNAVGGIVHPCPEGTICPISGYADGGGGAVGRLKILTRSGTLQKVGNPILSAATSVGALAGQ